MKQTTLLIALLGFALARSISAFAEAPDEPAASSAKPDETIDEKAVEGNIRPAPKNCPACAIGLTAEVVFERLDVSKDKSITVTEFQRGPGMQEKNKSC